MHLQAKKKRLGSAFLRFPVFDSALVPNLSNKRGTPVPLSYRLSPAATFSVRYRIWCKERPAFSCVLIGRDTMAVLKTKPGSKCVIKDWRDVGSKQRFLVLNHGFFLFVRGHFRSNKSVRIPCQVFKSRAFSELPRRS
jgi:hypothetical protein